MIDLVNVQKSYGSGDITVPVLRDVSLSIPKGDFIAIMGPSGSGKSTLLNIIGCLDSLDAGVYQLRNQRIDLLNDDELTQIRLRHMGFVFQMFNLIPRFNALRNVELPMIYADIPQQQRTVKAEAALKLVGLQDRAEHIPAKLSGGQQQRVAIARALVNNPDIIIADEPTGSLDSNTGGEIMRLFQGLNKSGKTIVMVTHEDSIAAYAQRVAHMRDGVITDIQYN